MQGEEIDNNYCDTAINSINNINCINKPYFFIENEFDANKVLATILNDKGCIIGVDIEAAVEMSRFGIPCLLQVFIIIIIDCIRRCCLHFRLNNYHTCTYFV